MSSSTNGALYTPGSHEAGQAVGAEGVTTLEDSSSVAKVQAIGIGADGTFQG